ncbi:hypothetical protein DPEC_G00346990 [Dallia pectoralis]|uniref:Uncharacterized protein n=1 Tax=Dallia pectoralis TaxID=75939 RepID=A0ACC2F4C5_DALPE|nr:hypothetical protein DPEC_G00346990 [Dallia pectoralis]
MDYVGGRVMDDSRCFIIYVLVTNLDRKKLERRIPTALRFRLRVSLERLFLYAHIWSEQSDGRGHLSATSPQKLPAGACLTHLTHGIAGAPSFT